MRTQWTRGLLAVVMLTACGQSGADVTVAGDVPRRPTAATAPVPTTLRPTARTLLPTSTSRAATTTTTAPARTTTTAAPPSRLVLTGNDAADFDAISVLDEVLDKTVDQRIDELTPVDFSDLTLVGGDQRSTGPTRPWPTVAC
jgi:hypothetical protein